MTLYMSVDCAVDSWGSRRHTRTSLPGNHALPQPDPSEGIRSQARHCASSGGTNPDLPRACYSAWKQLLCYLRKGNLRISRAEQVICHDSEGCTIRERVGCTSLGPRVRTAGSISVTISAMLSPCSDVYRARYGLRHSAHASRARSLPCSMTVSRRAPPTCLDTSCSTRHAPSVQLKHRYADSRPHGGRAEPACSGESAPPLARISEELGIAAMRPSLRLPLLRGCHRQRDTQGGQGRRPREVGRRHCTTL
jgi:hypothetical protein